MAKKADISREWLETDGLGGFASGTTSGIRSRRYHAILLIAKKPPAERVVLVNGFDAWVETPHGTFPISTQQYKDGAQWPEGHLQLQSFDTQPWPTWKFDLGNDTHIIQELFVPRGIQGTAMRWTIEGDRTGIKLHLKPFISGRDYHGLHHENPDICLMTERDSDCVRWQPYEDTPLIFAQSNGEFEEKPVWFHSFYYEVENRRGLDDMEDLGCPGEFHFDMERADAYLLLGANHRLSEQLGNESLSAEQVYKSVSESESKRRSSLGRLEKSAESYIVERGSGSTIIAGYPWFTDWGRDTFIAIRGICLALGNTEVARQILVGWADTVSQGMIPNRFPDQGDEPEFNSVDASLWYIVAIHDYWQALQRKNQKPEADETKLLQTAIEKILTGYSNGTRHRIGMDKDGLIAAGEDGVQLTWMDAKVGDWVVTPRIGKPVEIQALWINALSIGASFSDAWKSKLKLAQDSFLSNFWNEETGCLFDVIDCDHESGKTDAAIRPNQLLAVGGLPFQIIDGERASSIVDVVDQTLLTPLGPRSLNPDHEQYKPVYSGGIIERDGAYHQGTVWPWVIGPFVEAWLRVRGRDEANIKQVNQRFLDPLEAHLNEAGLDHISEIADAESPFTPRGCPFQAWSLGEYLRLKEVVLQEKKK